MRPYSEINASPSQATTEHKFTFTGSASEYFPIWLTNIALTVITLGIYGPWAKVRREKYFHEHTFVAGSSFEYTANPMSILKGRAIVVVIALAVSFLGSLSPIIQTIVILIGIVAMPWVVNQAIRFKGRYTLYRNIPFQFHGTYLKSLFYFIVLKLLAALPIGLLLPWAKHRERRYVLDHLSFGTSPFSLGSTVGVFYKMYLIAGALVVLPFGLLVLSMLYRLGRTFGSGSAASSADAGAMVVVIYLFILAMLLAAPLLKIGVAKATWNDASIAGLKVRYPVPVGKYLWVAASNTLMRYGTLGFASAYCSVRAHRFKLSYLSLEGAGSVDDFVSQRVQEIKAFGDEAGEAFDLDIDLGF